MPDPEEVVLEMFEALQPGGVIAYQQYILTRTPADYQELMVEYVTQVPVPPPDGFAVVGNSETIQLLSDSLDELGGVSASVEGNTLTGGIVPPGVAVVSNGYEAVVVDAGGDPVAGSPGVISVVSGEGTIEQVQLTV